MKAMPSTEQVPCDVCGLGEWVHVIDEWLQKAKVRRTISPTAQGSLGYGNDWIYNYNIWG